MPSATRVNLPLLTLGTPTAPGAYDPSTNKITAFSYDGRGNVAVVPSNIRTATYDGENRQKAATNLNGYSAEYFYDGDGRRVRKVYTQGQTVTTTTFVYDAMGQLAAEYGGTPEPGGRQYVTVDHLGSTRLVTNAQGAAVKTHDYLPFGEELNVACLDAPGGVKFTAHFRDQESCLDAAGARYLSSSQGQFTSPDPTFLNIRRVVNPQRWNQYSYTMNNPLRYVDPDGNEAIAVSYPFYMVEVGYGVKLPLGHAGVAIVSKEGQVNYFEFGRYRPAGAGGDVAQGVLRPGPEAFKPPSVTRDATGKITPESMKALLGALSNGPGKQGAVAAAVIDTSADEDGFMLNYLVERQKGNDNPNRQHYQALGGHNCGTLICDVLGAVGRPTLADRSWLAPSDIFGFIRSMFDSQTYLYQPKGKAKSRLCFETQEEKMECQEQ